MAAKVNLNDVAEAAGVSRRVASAVLNGGGGQVRFSQATQTRVMQAVTETGYRRNRTAVNMRRQRHGAVGLIAHDLGSIPALVLRHLILAARRQDLLVVIEPLADRVPKLLVEDCVDGMLLFDNVAPALKQELQDCRLPLAAVNTNDRHVPGAITFDDESAVRQIVDLFAVRGRCRPAFMQGKGATDHYSHAARFETFCVEANRLGLAEPVFLQSSDTWHETHQDTLEVLAAHPEIDCLLLYQDALAPAVYRAADILGRSIPDDLSVIGFNDSDFARAVSPRLTALRIDSEELAEEAMRLMTALLAGRTPASRTLQYEIQARESV